MWPPLPQLRFVGLNLYDPNLAINKALDIVWGEDGFMIFEDLGTKLEKRTLKSKFFILFNTFYPMFYFNIPNLVRVGGGDFSRKYTPIPMLALNILP